MPWLNWSLKLHIKLRTISSLVPTHITHVYAQWMPYSFVWLYLIKCVFTCSIFVDQTQKDFLVSYFVFGKFFIFAKISKTCVALFWRLNHGSSQSHAPVASLLRRFSRLTGGSKSQSWKILRKFFKIWVFKFLMAQFGDLFVGGGSSCEGTQRFSRLTSWLSCG